MMSFEEFKGSVADSIKNHLPEKYEDAEISISTVTKNNDTKLTGITLKQEDSNVSPCIYLNDYYKAYEEGTDFDELIKKLAEVYVSNDNKEYDVNQLTDFEDVKDKISCRVINAENNEEYLKDKPHTDIEDLAVVYSVVLGKEDDGIYSVMVDNRMLNTYGITVNELHETAVDNMSKQDVSFKTMRDTVMEMMFPNGVQVNDPFLAMMMPPEDEIPEIYVLTNDTGVYGASEILNTSFMDEIATQLGGDYIVLPSSVHETLIVPMSEEVDRETLEGLVQEVNGEAVRPADRLSDHVYQYDSKNHEIVRMDRMEERERSVAKETKSHDKSEEKTSLMDRISKKQDEISKKDSSHEHKPPTKNREEALA